jgi:hypothetical protein
MQNYLTTFRRMICSLLIWSAFSFVANPALSESQDDKMLLIIKQVKLGNNLSGIAYQGILNTQTYRMVVNKIGEDKANEIVKKELAADLPKYQDQWDKNLASTYLHYFTPDEMESIFKDKELSPYASKYLAERQNVGKAMMEKSKALVINLNTEVLTNIFHMITPEN